MGRYPTDEEGLQTLVINPGAVGWKGPYLKGGLKDDPWGTPYDYGRDPENPNHYVLRSAGPDKQFGTEDDCRNRLRDWRWPNDFTCDRCGSKKKPYRNKNRKNIYQCKNCGYQASLTAGTIFNKTRLPLTRWFLMIYLIAVTDKEIRLSYFQRLWDTDNYKAVWIMAGKIKKALAKSDDYLRLVGLVD